MDSAFAVAPGDHERGGGKVLHRSVVQRRSDPPSFRVRGIDRPLEQHLALALVPPGPRQQVPHQRGEQHDEEQQAAQRHAGEPAPQLPGSLADLLVRRVDLEQRLLSGVRPHRAVDLHQLVADVAVQGVLRAIEVRDLGDGAWLLQHLAFLGVQGERATDQPGLVGVQHLAVRAPDLHPDDVVAQHAVSDQRVEPLLGCLVAGEQPVGERRLYDGLRQHVRDVGGVVDRLALGQPASRERTTDRDDDQHQDDARDQADEDATGAQWRLVKASSAGLPTVTQDGGCVSADAGDSPATYAGEPPMTCTGWVGSGGSVVGPVATRSPAVVVAVARAGAVVVAAAVARSRAGRLCRRRYPSWSCRSAVVVAVVAALVVTVAGTTVASLAVTVVVTPVATAVVPGLGRAVGGGVLGVVAASAALAVPVVVPVVVRRPRGPMSRRASVGSSSPGRGPAPGCPGRRRRCPRARARPGRGRRRSPVRRSGCASWFLRGQSLSVLLHSRARDGPETIGQWS